MLDADAVGLMLGVEEPGFEFLEHLRDAREKAEFGSEFTELGVGRTVWLEVIEKRLHVGQFVFEAVLLHEIAAALPELLSVDPEVRKNCFFLHIIRAQGLVVVVNYGDGALRNGHDKQRSWGVVGPAYLHGDEFPARLWVGPRGTVASGEDPNVIEVAYRGGVLVPAIDLWMDPRVPRGLAFVSHAHSDHAGKHRETILSAGTSRLMRSRIGASPQEHVLDFGETRELRGAQFTLLPAGHVHGSAQLHLETEGGSLLYTGDFKLRAGLSSEPIAWRGAETLIMETTFGKPEFVFPPAEQVLGDMVQFCREALEVGAVPVLLGYSLGKAQEILCAVAAAGLKPMLHGAVSKLTKIYREGVPGMPEFAEYEAANMAGHVLICPPSVRNSRMVQRIKKRRVAMVTGWGLTPGAVHRYQVDAVFPLSDHAGYDDLLKYVELVQPQRVLTLHGYASEFARDLRRRGMEAWSLVSPDQLEFAEMFEGL